MEKTMILLLSDTLGDGDKNLGETLLETYFTLLKQEGKFPEIIFCMNRGVLTLTDDSFASLHLKELENKGVKILACKTCTDYYGISEKIVAGSLSSMKEMIQLSNEYKVITLS